MASWQFVAKARAKAGTVRGDSKENTACWRWAAQGGLTLPTLLLALGHHDDHLRLPCEGTTTKQQQQVEVMVWVKWNQSRRSLMLPTVASGPPGLGLLPHSLWIQDSPLPSSPPQAQKRRSEAFAVPTYGILFLPPCQLFLRNTKTVNRGWGNGALRFFFLGMRTKIRLRVFGRFPDAMSLSLPGTASVQSSWQWPRLIYEGFWFVSPALQTTSLKENVYPGSAKSKGAAGKTSEPPPRELPRGWRERRVHFSSLLFLILFSSLPPSLLPFLSAPLFLLPFFLFPSLDPSLPCSLSP